MLKLIILHRFTAGTLEMLLTFGALNFINKDVEAIAYKVVGFFSLSVEHAYIHSMLNKAGMIGNKVIVTTSLMLFISGVISLVEGYGLHKRRKWAEWCAVISTSTFFPFTIYAIIVRGSSFTIAMFIFNIYVVYYLISHRKLFHKKYDIMPR